MWVGMKLILQCSRKVDCGARPTSARLFRVPQVCSDQCGSRQARMWSEDMRCNRASTVRSLQMHLLAWKSEDDFQIRCVFSRTPSLSTQRSLRVNSEFARQGTDAHLPHPNGQGHARWDRHGNRVPQTVQAKHCKLSTSSNRATRCQESSC
jgi:hypothetical protein